MRVLSNVPGGILQHWHFRLWLADLNQREGWGGRKGECTFDKRWVKTKKKNRGEIDQEGREKMEGSNVRLYRWETNNAREEMLERSHMLQTLTPSLGNLCQSIASRTRALFAFVCVSAPLVPKRHPCLLLCYLTKTDSHFPGVVS